MLGQKKRNRFFALKNKGKNLRETGSTLPKLPIGQIQFYDSYHPALDDGLYTIKVEPELTEVKSSLIPVSLGADTKNDPNKEVMTQKFFVNGPRFAYHRMIFMQYLQRRKVLENLILTFPVLYLTNAYCLGSES